MSDLWPWYAKVATAAEGQNAEPGDSVQKMYECVYATVAVALMALGYPDTEPTDLMNLIHPQGHVGGESYDVATTYLQAHPERWPNLPRIELVNPADTLAHIHEVLANGYAALIDVKDDANAQPVARFGAWHGSHSVVLVGDDNGQITIWNPWAGNLQRFSNDFFRQATTNEAGIAVGNFMVFQRDIRQGQGETEMKLLSGDGTDPKGRGKGAVYATDGLTFKRYISTSGELTDLIKAFGPVVSVTQWTIDRIPFEVVSTPATHPGGEVVDFSGGVVPPDPQIAAIKADLDRIFK